MCYCNVTKLYVHSHNTTRVETHQIKLKNKVVAPFSLCSKTFTELKALVIGNKLLILIIKSQMNMTFTHCRTIHDWQDRKCDGYL